ncbi:MULTISPECIES: quinone oxidoreductase [Methylobacterium]|jgi:NADPH2:quinone reductase|uniref:quinone oxidoreductase family protein n=1 Tax=Methylobacterium TaxID=407 RepID=UPI0008EC235D|nr:MULTISPECIES: quinone oxidoreductase [Methylobacterium]MBZ6411699.1 quinone oxidoreductase [Methylobacterium sp.]MBK3400309.1 quinone oxidoreductase [Methylobacterium ajmalii]MBK3411835.1 quinone oxidoreductase [Methylobacterium ajmalii]MBK3420500.1 quinone oxidoreductase [Methylobacterium ajmalii]SFE43685.1 NADPH2:quinone reductase [Methylobacterium sp. yr596]
MATTRSVVITEFGPPQVMTLQSRDLPAPGAGEAQLRQTAIGFNFIDVYQRRGAYPLERPTGLGFEAAGVVEAVGPGVVDLKPGDRVAYMNAGVGAYADRRTVPAEKLVRLPESVSDEAAASLLFKGMTAQYLLRKTHAVQPGDLLLVHSAAGGVGQILTRWATALGAKVVGTTGSPEKREAALAAGCAAVIDLNQPDWPKAFLEATGGAKARVVYDAVGKDTLLKSLDCAAPFGLVVSYGAASGPSPAIDPELLNKKGCLFLTRPSVFPHNADPATFRANAADLFDAIGRGHVAVDVGARFPLEKVVEAHEAAEARKVTGAIVLVP